MREGRGREMKEQRGDGKGEMEWEGMKRTKIASEKIMTSDSPAHVTNIYVHTTVHPHGGRREGYRVQHSRHAHHPTQRERMMITFLIT